MLVLSVENGCLHNYSGKGVQSIFQLSRVLMSLSDALDELLDKSGKGKS